MRLANFAPSSVSSRKKLLDCYIYGGLSYKRQFSCQFVRSVNSYVIIFDPEESLYCVTASPRVT